MKNKYLKNQTSNRIVIEIIPKWFILRTRGMLLLTKAKRPLKFKYNKHAVKLRMHKAAPYAFPIPLNTFWSYKSNDKGDIRQKLQSSYLWPQLGSGGKTDRLFRLSTSSFSIPLNTFWSYKSNNKGDIRQKLKISYFMTPVWPIRGGPGGKTDQLFRLSTYAFPIPLNTFWRYKSNNKGDISQNSKATILWPQFDP